MGIVLDSYGPLQVDQARSVNPWKTGWNRVSDARARLKVADLELRADSIQAQPRARCSAGLAVLYSGWKLNGVPEQSLMLVCMNPFAAEAIM